MFGLKKQKIRWEKRERLVLPNVFRRFCPQCQTEQIFVSAEQATYLTNLTARQLFRLVEIGEVHFFETEEGFLFVCEDLFNESVFYELQDSECQKATNLIDLVKKHFVLYVVLFFAISCTISYPERQSKSDPQPRQKQIQNNDFDGEKPNRPTRNGGGNPQELVGKWCYLANVQANDGGRMSERCFVLNSNGTYEYFAETSSSNPYGGTNSQEYDAGRWSATATTITAQSNSGETYNYSLEKRNHPKTGDPMLIVDGDAFVTFNQRQPW